jgi:hypothetical protein
MKPTTKRKGFAPHITRYRNSVLVSALGVGVGVAAWVLQVPAVGGLAGLWAACRAWTMFKDGTKRHHGFMVEAEHVAKLREACAAKGWKVDTDVWVDGVGNLDAVVCADLSRVVIEVKSHGGLREVDGSVVRCNKLKTSASREVDQVNNQALDFSQLYNVPRSLVTRVLWCPNAPFESVKQTNDGLVLANGAGQKLIDFIAEVAWLQREEFMGKPLFPDEVGRFGQRRPEVKMGALDTVRARVLA